MIWKCEKVYGTLRCPIPHQAAKAAPIKIVAFLLPFCYQNDTAERRSFLYRKGLKTFALDGVGQRCKGDRRSFLARNKKVQNIMLQSNTIPDEAYVLLLQKHSFILDILADLPGTIQIKNKITEVFTYYILFSGEGSEESKD